MPSITSFLFRARGGELKPLLAVGSTLIASLWALRRVSAGPIRQLNGGRGGSFEFVDPRGKCVVVTGCDSGFGFLTAVELARLGFVVFAGVFNPDVSRTLLENELKALEADRNARNITGVTFDPATSSTLAPLGQIIPVPLDVTSDDSVNSFYSTVTTHPSFQPSGLYSLLNNAGINAGYIVEMSNISHLEQNMAVNYYGAARMVLKFLPLLRTSAGSFKEAPETTDQPRLVNVTSGAGIMVSSPLGPYSASKHALEGLTDSLRQELSHHEIPLHCTLIEPSIALTPIVTQDLSAQFDRYLADSNISPEVLEAYGGYEYQKAQWCLSAVHLKAKAGTSMILQPEDVVKSIVEEVARKKGMNARRPVPDFGMGLILALYQNLPTRWVDSILALQQKEAVLEKLAEMQAEKEGGGRVVVGEKVIVPA